MVQSDFPQRPVGAHNSGATISSATEITIPSGARYVRIQTLTQNVRYTLDGTDPTASSGFQLKAGDPPITLYVETGVTLKVIQETSGAVLQYQFLN